MLGEHIFYSVAIAIIVGTLFEKKYGYALPIWIIAVCAWVPDMDYIIQSIMFEMRLWDQWFFIQHGDFHNFTVILVFSLIAAYLLETYKDYDFKSVFLCFSIGMLTHLLCDYLVYESILYPFSRLCSWIKIVEINVFPETGSWYSIGELPLYIGGIFAVMLALIIKFHYTENPWIGDSPSGNQEEV